MKYTLEKVTVFISEVHVLETKALILKAVVHYFLITSSLWTVSFWFYLPMTNELIYNELIYKLKCERCIKPLLLFFSGSPRDAWLRRGSWNSWSSCKFFCCKADGLVFSLLIKVVAARNILTCLHCICLFQWVPNGPLSVIEFPAHDNCYLIHQPLFIDCFNSLCKWMLSFTHSLYTRQWSWKPFHRDYLVVCT